MSNCFSGFICNRWDCYYFQFVIYSRLFTLVINLVFKTIIIFIFSLNRCIERVSIWNCNSESKSNTTWNKMQKPVIQSTLFVGMLYMSIMCTKKGLPTANCVQNVTVWFVFQQWCVCLALWYHSSSSYGIVTFNRLCLSSGTHGRLWIPRHKQKYLQ